MSTEHAGNPRVGTVRYRDAEGEIIGLPRRIERNTADSREEYALDRLYAMFIADCANPKVHQGGATEDDRI